MITIESLDFKCVLNNLYVLLKLACVPRMFKMCEQLKEWMESFLTDDVVNHLADLDARVPLIAVVTRNTNELFRLLYSNGAWLHCTIAAEVARRGLLSVRANKRLAQVSVQFCQPRYPIHPKLHMLFHGYRFLEQWSLDHEWCESPLVDGCQVDESFVGVISRYSRRVSPKITVQRTYDLYLTSMRHHVQGDDQN